MIIEFKEGKAAMSDNVISEKCTYGVKLIIPEGECVCIALTRFLPISIDGKMYHPTMKSGLIDFNLDTGYLYRMWMIPKSNALEIANITGLRLKDITETDIDKKMINKLV